MEPSAEKHTTTTHTPAHIDAYFDHDDYYHDHCAYHHDHYERQQQQPEPTFTTTTDNLFLGQLFSNTGPNQ